jgi:hypothetical protein
MPAAGTTEELVLLVEHTADATAQQRARMAETCRQRVNEATGLRVEAVVVLSPGTLPRTSSGKIRRAEAFAQHRTGTLTAPDRPGLVHMGRSFLSSGAAYARLSRTARGTGDRQDSAPQTDGSANAT